MEQLTITLRYLIGTNHPALYRLEAIRPSGQIALLIQAPLQPIFAALEAWAHEEAKRA